MLDNNLTFYLAGCIFFLWMIISKRKAKPKKEGFVQLLNPKTKRYIKFDKTKGSIVAHKKTRGPYRGIEIVS